MAFTINGTNGLTFPDSSTQTTRAVSRSGDTMSGVLNLTHASTVGSSATAGELILTAASSGGSGKYTDIDFHHGGYTSDFKKWRLGNNGVDDFLLYGVSNSGTSFNEFMRVQYTTGIMTRAYTPCFMVRKTNGTNATAGGAVIVCDFVQTNQAPAGYGYNTSTGRFTAPITGNYMFVGVISSSSTTPADAQIRKNGSSIFHTYSSASLSSATAITIVSLSKDDYTDFYAVSGYRGDNHTGFSGFLIG